MTIALSFLPLAAVIGLGWFGVTRVNRRLNTLRSEYRAEHGIVDRGDGWCPVEQSQDCNCTRVEDLYPDHVVAHHQ